MGYCETSFFKQSKIKHLFCIELRQRLIKNANRIPKTFNALTIKIVPNLGTKVERYIYVTLSTFLTQLKKL